MCMSYSFTMLAIIGGCCAAWLLKVIGFHDSKAAWDMAYYSSAAYAGAYLIGRIFA